MGEPHLDQAASSKDDAFSDGSLVRRFLSGEQDAATDLYVRYAQRLERVARAQMSPSLSTRIDPDDVVQSVFRTFFRRLAIGDYRVPQGEDLWKLLLVISLNKIRTLGTFHRAAKRDIGQTMGLDAGPAAGRPPATGDDIALRTLELTVEELLGELPPHHAPIIRLRIEGHEVGEIAQLVVRSKRTVERVLQGFRERLATLVGEEIRECEQGGCDHR